MKINEASVRAKVNAFMRSPEGKAKAKETLVRYEAEGKTTTEAGSILVQEKTVRELADVLVSFIKLYATYEYLPDSVVDSINTLHVNGIEKDNSRYTVSLDFDAGSLWRPSLKPDRYGGVSNIIALFDTGYEARAAVKGYWHGRWTKSLTWRPASHFLQRAIEQFLDDSAVYGLKINIELDSIYEGTQGGTSRVGPRLGSGPLPY